MESKSWTEKNSTLKNLKLPPNDASFLEAVDFIEDALKEDGLTTEDDKPVVKDIEGKAKLSLVPRRIIWDIAKIREYGNKKYPSGGPDNWKLTDVQNYKDAAFRHFMLYLDDPSSVDEESGYRHLWHLACNIAFLCEMDDDEFADDAE